MENLIAKLVQDFEQGKMNRRQLIQSLSIAAAAAAVPTTVIGAAAPPTGKLEAGYVNHISYSCNDYKKVRDFYVDLLGMKVTQDDGMQCRLVFGNNILIPRNRSNGGPAKVDHIAYTVINWDSGEGCIRGATEAPQFAVHGTAPRPASRSRTRRGWAYSSADCVNDQVGG